MSTGSLLTPTEWAVLQTRANIIKPFINAGDINGIVTTVGMKPDDAWLLWAAFDSFNKLDGSAQALDQHNSFLALAASRGVVSCANASLVGNGVDKQGNWIPGGA